MKYLPLAYALLATPASAGYTFPNGQYDPNFFPVVSVNDYGDTGSVVAQGRIWSPGDPVSRFLIITGNNPQSMGEFEVSTLPLGIGGGPSGYPRALCNANIAWTEAEYAEGYPIPYWPATFGMEMSNYNDTTGTVTVKWHAVDKLQPLSNYSIIVICPHRTAPGP